MKRSFPSKGYPLTVEKVNVSRGVLVGIVAVAAASLLALAFVIGRETGSGGVPPLTKIERVAPRIPEARDASPTPNASSVFAAPLTESPGARLAGASPPYAREQGAAPQQSAALAGAPAERGSPSDAERAAVAAYFEAIDRIQPTEMNGEAESVAGGIASALANGDTSGLDRMIRDTEAAKARLAAVATPPPCAVHHRESLGSLDDALEVIRSLKASMASSDPAGALAAVSARGNALRSRAEALKKEEGTLRDRYGLKR